ncbi:hypothetical protein [Adhaeretor mobilis]|uniref:Uncharacterized protein n=1 Tax=Adhaeretor mobilis TaxID=1930276 RepID=A0A517N1A9_9BACT|nr:hypothetical protein [Adhaeretor mobilis]QDT00913.1 hypothetical protein HG15A2_42550 [Adhaeretor mobilis]
MKSRNNLTSATISICAMLLSALLFVQAPSAIAGTIYDFELLDNGRVIADNGNDTAFPSVIRVPSWIPPAERADADANYYMYYGNHGGERIRMKWAQSLEGPWTTFDLGGEYNGRNRRGVFDIDADSTRDTYDHVSAPDVHVDEANQQIVMYFHGQNQPSTTTSGGTSVPRKHESFVTTSASGLNFNDPTHAGGESGHGPKTVTVDDITRDIWIGEDYQRAFEVDGSWYSIGKRGIINASPNPLDPWAPLAGNPFGEAWTRESTPSSLWTSDANPGGQDDYYSPAASFIASSEFAAHPRNPLPGERVLSNGNDERFNHVSVNLISPDALEIFFYVREANSSAPDRYDDLYRVVLDVSDSDFENWEVARDSTGQAYFDVVISAEELHAAVETANGIGSDPDDYADPVSLGDSDIFVDEDGSKYLFLSYVSDQNGGALGEGQITGVKLNLHPDFNYDDEFDGLDFLQWQRGDSFSPLSESDLAAWQTSYGASLNSLAVTNSVPEPSSSLLLLMVLAFVPRRNVMKNAWSA